MLNIRNWLSGHRILTVVLAILLVVVGIVAMQFSGITTQSSENTPTPHPSPGPITVIGEITCLPHKGDGPHTLECAFGLRAEDGKHYSLQRLNQDQLIDGTLTVQTKVEVSGQLSPAKPDEKYDIVGYIAIEDIEVIAVNS